MKLKLTITDLCLEVDDTPGPTAQPLNLAPLERLIAELTRTVANFPVPTAPQIQPAAPVVDPTPNIISVTDITDLSLQPPGEMISLEPAIATSTNGHNPDVIDELQVESSRRLKFADLDKLVRIEMQRLNVDGRMPSMSLWDSARKPPLPTMGALLYRYGVGRITELAQKLDMPPPLSAK